MMWSLMHLVAIVLCVQIFQVRSSFGQKCQFVLEDGTQLEDPDGFGYSLPGILDSELPGKELLVAEVTDVSEITSVTWPQERHYIEPSLNATHLLLKLTDEFTQYEEYQTNKRTGITLYFPCTEPTKKKIEFILTINDTNNHDPQFMSDPYVYELPMPLPKDLALTNFAPISARDIDLTNENISFRLDGNPSGLSVSWLSFDQKDPKLHNAKLFTTATISLVKDVTFNLIATDTGEPPLSTTTTVTIQVDHENSILHFAQPLYTANLTELTPEAANGTIITFDEGEVILGSGAYKNVEYNVQDESGVYSKNFKLIVADDHATVTLQLIDPPASFFQESSILLKLTASKLGSTETTILHITLPGSGKTIPEPGGSDNSGESGESGESEDTPVATIVLGVLLAIVGIGLVASVIVNCRQWRNQNIRQ